MKATIMVGAPGAGKTTFVKTLQRKNATTTITGDDIRSEFPDPAWVEIWDRLEEEIISASQKGKDIVIDGTHVGRKDREETVALLHSHGYYQVDAVIIDTPLELCLERNSKRSRVVPTYVVEHMHKTLERSLPHIHTEPFTKVTVIS